MTTITLPRRIMRPVASPPARRSVLIGFFATLFAGLLLLGGFSAALGVVNGARVLSGVSVGGVPVGGLERAAAEERLLSQLPSLSSGSATVALDGEEHVLPYAALGRDYEMAAMLDAAHRIGRDGNPIAEGIARLRALVRPTALPVMVHAYDPEALEATAVTLSRDVHVSPVEGAVLRDGTAFEVRPSSPGRVLAPETIGAALATAVDTADPADVRIELTPTVVPPIVSTAEAAAAAEMARETTAAMELTIPGAADEAPLELSAETVASWISFGPQAEASYAMRIDAGAASAVVAGFVEAVDRDPVSATISVAGSGLGGVVPGQTGRELDVDGSTNALLAGLADRGGGAPVPSLALAVDITEPALTTAEAEEILPQMRMVSSWTTNYVSNEGNGYSANISIPAWDIDGYNLAPGEWFSFWEGIGPVTVERGYTYGGAIINGRSTQGVALAGGICSTSTTLFNAAMRAGLEIGDRRAHYYYIDRYPVGLDATVSIFDDYVTDMTFRNDTEHPVVIRGYGTPGQVTFQIWGVPNGRTVALSDAYITDRRSAIETTQVDTSMAPGSARRVEYPHDGFKSTVSRTVYGPDGGILHENTWFSDYRVVNGITAVGPAAPAPPPADEGDAAVDPPVGDPPGEDPPPEDPPSEDPPAEEPPPEEGA